MTRRRVNENDERVLWAFDAWDSVAAEVGAAMAVGSRRASKEMRIAEALRDRLPQVAALARKGALSSRLVSAITWGTRLVDDAEAVAMIDAAIAERATRWEVLSEDKLRDAVDVQVTRYDRDALRRTRIAIRGRDFTVGACEDDAETTSVWGRLLAPDAAVGQQRITAMVDGVCAGDPRSIGERRSDAVGALFNGNDTLACRCGSPACPTAGAKPEVQCGDPGRSPTKPPSTPPPPRHPNPLLKHPPRNPHRRRCCSGVGCCPIPCWPRRSAMGRQSEPIRTPGVEPEPRYRPSDELAEFVRMRDLFCRFPGCAVAADRCDIDHAHPGRGGPLTRRT